MSTKTTPKTGFKYSIKGPLNSTTNQFTSDSGPKITRDMEGALRYDPMGANTKAIGASTGQTERDG